MHWKERGRYGMERLFRVSQESWVYQPRKGLMQLDKRQDVLKRYVPDAASVYSVLGNLFEARNDRKRAVECYAAALKLNPFLWESFERTCNTGA